MATEAMTLPISAIILNWKRPDNVRRILTGLDVDEVIVFNNNPAAEFVNAKAACINANADLGLTTRFAAGLLARNDCLLYQDDDIEFPPETLQALYEASEREPEVIHGIFGRKPRPNGRYAHNVRGNAECEIVLTRVAMLRKHHLRAFFELAADELLTSLLERGKPQGNGEDIICSYAAIGLSGRLNRVYDLPLKELPAPNAIHARWGGHMDHRTAVLNRCQVLTQPESASRIAASGI